MLDEMGFGMDVMKRDGFQIVLVELTAGFHLPATLHDRLVITTTVGESKRSTTHWTQQARKDEALVASLAVKAAFTDARGRPVRAPQGFAEAAQRFA
jgi:acyl-CoA thioesterase FadM